jgi:hypothetical protein
VTLCQSLQTAEKWNTVAYGFPCGGGKAMKTSRYTEEQIAYTQRLAESGTPVADVCRQMGIAEATFYSGRRSTAAWGRLRCVSSGTETPSFANSPWMRGAPHSGFATAI